MLPPGLRAADREHQPGAVVPSEFVGSSGDFYRGIVAVGLSDASSCPCVALCSSSGSELLPPVIPHCGSVGTDAVAVHLSGVQV